MLVAVAEDWKKQRVLQIDFELNVIPQFVPLNGLHADIILYLTYASVQYKRSAGVGKTIDTGGMLHHPGASLSECLIHSRVGDHTCWHAAILHPAGSATMATQGQVSHSTCELRSIQRDSSCVWAVELVVHARGNFCDSHQTLSRGRSTDTYSIDLSGSVTVRASNAFNLSHLCSLRFFPRRRYKTKVA